MAKKSNAAFMVPHQPDEVLGAIVGHKPISRPQITKKLWAYIRKVGIQDGRNILAGQDPKFKAFAGKKVITMFEMAKIVSKHLD